jgi:hypothetical protein
MGAVTAVVVWLHGLINQWHTWQTQLRTTTSERLFREFLRCTRVNRQWHYFLVDHSHVMNPPKNADAAVKGFKNSSIRAVLGRQLYRQNIGREESKLEIG